jgi:hypothetical protein
MALPEVQPKSVAYYHDINLVKNQLFNAKLHPVSTVERTALASTLNSNDKGLTVYDKDITIFYVWDGNEFKPIGLTDAEIEMVYESFDRSVMEVDVSSTQTQRTVTLTYRDDTFIQDSYAYAYIHTQNAPSNTWVVSHNLGKYPSVTIVDSTEEEVIGEVLYTDTNIVTLRFTAAFSGKAYIN